MSGKIQIVDRKDVEPVVLDDAHGPLAKVSKLIDRSHGSNRIQLFHSFVQQGFAMDAQRMQQDELVYVISGAAEVEFEGEKHRLGPGTAFFAPAGAKFHYRTLATPHETIAIISPPDEA